MAWRSFPQAIEDARENARRNGIENVEFFVGKAEEVLPEQYERNHVHADVIVVDPPRKGCDPVCLETILKMAPERVVYVSCDSATPGQGCEVPGGKRLPGNACASSGYVSDGGTLRVCGKAGASGKVICENG